LKILLDECLPRRLALLLPGHDVRTVRDMDWLGLSNGKLLAAADPHFDLFLTVDRNLVQQQKLEGLYLAVIVLHAKSNKIEDLTPLVEEVLAVLPTIKPGQVVDVGT
jgi:hypothetical protein